mmetsp:Transcript_5999/g.10662  ORF Transcript_5999/g.10662 Transcript_5999/m.10662 type:complete len:148 (+) Transcript_5999:102-545(+)
MGAAWSCTTTEPEWHDLSESQFRPTPNQQFAAPEGFAKKSQPQISLGTFPVDAETLKANFKTVAMEQPRVTLLGENDEFNQLRFLQRSKTCKFPDVLTVQFIPKDESHSQMAIYSYSRYGNGDHGVNEKRIRTWVEGTEKLVGAQKK